MTNQKRSRTLHRLPPLFSLMTTAESWKNLLRTIAGQKMFSEPGNCTRAVLKPKLSISQSILSWFTKKMNEEQKILPVPEGVSRPLWSVMIPVYNRTKFVRQAVESVLAQDPEPDQMQICIVANSTESID
jgi:Glycosyl transferase family 2